MNLTFDIWGIILCAVASMITGMLWYGPLFGKQWMKLSGIKMTDKQMEAAKKKGMGKQMFAAFIGSAITAWVLSLFLGDFGITTLSASLYTGFFVWLGFMATTTLSGVLWEGKPKALYILNNAHLLVNILIMSIILTYI